ncbi:MAG: hypothetical protein AAB520_02550 [Patescibacteria group bacterium]
MDQIQKHKEQVEKQIVDMGIDKYGDGTISKEELSKIADFVVEGMEKVKTQQDLSEFLAFLASRWSFFQNLVTIEQGAVKEASDKQVYTGALDLAKHGRIDEAVKLAKTATTKSVIN